MDISTRKFAHGFLFCLGLVLMVASIAAQTMGALPIGLIVAAVNFRHWHMINTGQVTKNNDHPSG